MNEETTFTQGSTNVFADLGFPNPEEHLLKAQLVHKISTIMKERNLTQVAAARILGVKQPDVSNLIRGQFRVVSVEKLLRYLIALGQDVEIVVKPTAPHGTASGQLSVS